MKNSIIIFIFSALILSGCQQFDTDTSFNDSYAQLVVSLDIPAPSVAKTRANITDELTSLYVLVFDKNGLYLSRYKGEIVSSTATTANYKFGSMPTTKEGEMLILHFVANYDWALFSDAANVGKGEAEVMNKLTVTDGTVAYWQRVELPGGIVGTKNTTITLTDDVSLLRNIAKVTVKNLTNERVTSSYLTDVSFAIGGYVDRGTVAPYSASSRRFTKGAITEALDGTIIPVSDDESEFVSAQNGSGGNQSEAKYIYERKNSTARNQTYMIIKAYFQNTLEPANATRPSYYKIDFVGSRTATELLDIERNYHYIMQINDVAMEGYSTLQEAVDNPASNNINAAVLVAEYTTISDGTHVLQIEKAAYLFVNSNQDFQIKYSYYDIKTGVVDNSKVTVTLVQDEAMKVVNGGVFTNVNGVISARTADIPTNNNIYQATFIISALPPGELSRKITVRLRKPMDFLKVSTTPNDGNSPTNCVVANQVGQPVTITFCFPPDISPDIFPLPVYVYSKKLSPDPTKMGVNPLSVDPLPNGTFRYVYMAPYLGNDANDRPHTHTIYLVSSTPSSNEEMILASEYFNNVPMQLRSVNIPPLNNIKFNPNPVLKLKDQPVDLTFDIPVVSDQTLPYRIRIHTDYLEYVSTTTGVKCEWDEELGLYVYETNTTDNQKISFKVKQIESSEYVRIDGDRFTSSTIRRMTAMGEFKNVLVDVTGNTSGSRINFNFSFNEAGDIYAAPGAYVYFTTQYLLPALGSGIETTGKTNEYRMPISSVGTHTASFVLKEDMILGGIENVKMSSSTFNDYYAEVNIFQTHIFGSRISGYSNRPVLYSEYYATPVSLSGRDGMNTQLHFYIPGGAASEKNPLWVYFKCTSRITLFNNTHTGIAEVSPAGSSSSGNEFWLKITASGDKIVSFVPDSNSETGTMTLMSVSGAGAKTSNSRFITATGFENN